MPQIPIIMPQLGESIAEATIISFLVKPGDQVAADQDVVEVETNKASMNVSSPCPGRVQKWLVKAGESYLVGAVLGHLEVSAEEAARLGLDETGPVPGNGAPASSATNGKKSDAEFSKKPQSSPRCAACLSRPTRQARAT